MVFYDIVKLKIIKILQRMKRIKAIGVFLLFGVSIAGYVIPTIGNIFLSVICMIALATGTCLYALWARKYSAVHFLNTLHLFFILACWGILRLAMPTLSSLPGLSSVLLWAEFVISIISGIGYVLYLIHIEGARFPGD